MFNCSLDHSLTRFVCATVTTLLENPKGPVKLGNPNTCNEVKLCYFFIYAGSRNSSPRD